MPDDYAEAAADSAGSVSITSMSITEGDNGTKSVAITVTRTGGTGAFDVDYRHLIPTRLSDIIVFAYGRDVDFLGSGTLHFAENENTQTIPVTINGDTEVEGNEFLPVILLNATNNVTISGDFGGVSILNDDSASAATRNDFNNDGKSDILWQNDNGTTTIWRMDGFSPTDGPFYDIDPSWHAIGTGDFNGDGNSDILWQNTSGATTIWQMDGFGATGGPIYSVDPSWHPVVG
jgi:hypothetical protein